MVVVVVVVATVVVKNEVRTVIEQPTNDPKQHSLTVNEVMSGRIVLVGFGLDGC